jgi:hypothetical protein
MTRYNLHGWVRPGRLIDFAYDTCPETVSHFEGNF